jgi:hypothetical protein
VQLDLTGIFMHGKLPTLKISLIQVKAKAVTNRKNLYFSDLPSTFVAEDSRVRSHGSLPSF